MDLAKFLLPCLPLSRRKTNISTLQNAFNEKQPLLATSSPTMTIQEAASSIISTLQSAKTTDARSSLNVKIQDIVHQAGGWSEYLATAILSNLERLLRAANSLELELSGVLKKAYDKACEAADEFKDFVKEHPIATEIFCTVIAIGILAVLMPWVLGLLGFGVEGPIEGTWAALWQATYRGFVPKGSLWSFFQRLGMKVGKKWVE